jgi:SAM-dependent methyltransferase
VDYQAKQFYQDERVAHTYDVQFHSPLRLANLRVKLVGWGEQKAFLRLLNQVPVQDNVLDIACGTGRYVELLLRRGYQVGGMDISSEMLAIAQDRAGHHSNLLFLRQGDAANLPFEDGQFDGVTCMRLYHRVPPPVRLQMLGEVKRVGRGWAILFFGMTTPWLDLRREIRSKLFPGRPSNPYPVSLAEMLSEFRALGLILHSRAWVLPGIAEGMVVLVKW